MVSSTEYFYQGGYSSFNPENNPYSIGYQLGAGGIGFPGSAQTANQIEELDKAARTGTRTFEVSLVVPETAEKIPKQHFKEMRALIKLTGIKPSVHGPLVDAAGFTREGWGGEEERRENERKILDSLEKAHEIDPNGKIPLVLHSTVNIPGAQYKKTKEEKYHKEKIPVLNLEDKKISFVESEKRHRFGTEKFSEGEMLKAEDKIEIINNNNWHKKITEIANSLKTYDELVGPYVVELQKYKNAVVRKVDGKEVLVDRKTNEVLPIFDQNKFNNIIRRINEGNVFLTNAQLGFRDAVELAYKYGDDEQKKKIEGLSSEYRKFLDRLEKERYILPNIELKEKISDMVHEIDEITARKVPQMYVNAEEFAKKKAAETFGDIAFKSYSKFKENAPVIAIENLWEGMAFSRAEELRELVDLSRKEFKKNLVKSGVSEDEAERIAKEKIGVTWDVGHLNIFKKKGYEDVDIVEQTKKISPYVKHIHLTDNFGYSDSHLAPGMGNVPIKEILKELEKNKKFEEMAKIVEAPGFIEHFKRGPHPMTLMAFDSPIYGITGEAGWGRAFETSGEYFTGFGEINPTIHQSIYGSGFSNLPSSLGGQISEEKSRFSEAPMD